MCKHVKLIETSPILAANQNDAIVPSHGQGTKYFAVFRFKETAVTHTSYHNVIISSWQNPPKPSKRVA
jgi:hypothetical protein